MGMQITKSLPELEASELARKAADNAESKRIQDTYFKSKQVEVTKRISLHLKKVWDQVKQDNKSVRTQTIALLKRARGEYSQEKLAAIKAFKGSETYIRSGENKCRSAYSWITDIYRGDNTLPWDLEPTAVPSLPDETKAQIEQEIMKQGMVLQQQLIMQEQEGGQPYNPATVAKTMNDWHEVAQRKAVEQINKDAKKRCEKAALQIRDDNQEGGWDDAFKNFLWYFLRCKCGIIKGPILKKKRKDVWTPSADGSFALVTEETIANDVYCVSPFNFYPSAGMTTVNDGDIIEVHELTRQSLTDLIGAPGYSEEEVRAVLSKVERGDMKARWLTIDDETAVRQVEREKYITSGTPAAAAALAVSPNGKIQAIEFYGSVSGSMLIEWGLNNAGIDAHMEYQANCWMIGTHVIKAVINPDGLGRKPYHVTSWAKSPSWIMGEGLLEFAEPIEDILNAIARALQNNIAIASGPQVEKNKDRCDDKTPMYPWKIWESTTAQMKEGPALAFYQPQMHAQELITAFEFFGKLLDEMTVPAYAQGASQSGVTAGTATVFTQLLAAASRSIKAVVANIDDDIITPYIKMCYDNLMKFSDDQELKGDAAVQAKGVSGLLAKEQAAQRKVEFLQVCAAPQFAQTLGAKNIGYILSEIAKSNDLHLPDMERLEGSPSLEELLTKMNSAAGGIDPSQATGQIASGGTPAGAQSLTMDGAPAGAPDQQQPAQIAQ